MQAKTATAYMNLSQSIFSAGLHNVATNPYSSLVDAKQTLRNGYAQLFCDSKLRQASQADKIKSNTPTQWLCRNVLQHN